MARFVLIVSQLALGAAGGTTPSLRGSSQSGEGSSGKCCFNGCGDPHSCVADACTTKEQCLAPQGQHGGCDSSPPYGHGNKPSWCPGLAAPVAVNETGGEGKCCFNGCLDEHSCVTDYCTTKEQCLSPQPAGGCDSSPPHGQGAKPSWCPAFAPPKPSGRTPELAEELGGATEGGDSDQGVQDGCVKKGIKCYRGDTCCSGACNAPIYPPLDMSGQCIG